MVTVYWLDSDDRWVSGKLLQFVPMGDTVLAMIALKSGRITSLAWHKLRTKKR